MVDILLPTWNRLELLKQTLHGFYTRTKTPFRLIIVDNGSTDGTVEYLSKVLEEQDILIADGRKRSIAKAFDVGFKHVESEYFITTNDDIIPPLLDPDWYQRLLELIKKYPDHGGIDCRVQRIPNIDWNNNHPDLAYPRKSLGGYLRIQKREDVIKMGGFGDRTWDDIEFYKRMTSIGKKCAYAKNLWAKHLGWELPNKGYKDFKDYPLYKKEFEDISNMHLYPKIDEKTNQPV